MENPALKEFLAQLGSELRFAQVLICRLESGFELRHIEDGTLAFDTLHAFKPEEARLLAQYTSAGEFRPLKSAPTLARGWCIFASGDAALEIALNRLYPGALADWRASRWPQPPVTNYRDFVNRQTGMYRITAMLTDAQVTQTIRTVCSPTSCLKQRLWTVAGVKADVAADKSLIPCLEPCAVLMESARQRFRADQTEKNESPTKLAAEAQAG